MFSQVDMWFIQKFDYQTKFGVTCTAGRIDFLKVFIAHHEFFQPVSDKSHLLPGAFQFGGKV